MGQVWALAPTQGCPPHPHPPPAPAGPGQGPGPGPAHTTTTRVWLATGMWKQMFDCPPDCHVCLTVLTFLTSQVALLVFLALATAAMLFTQSNLPPEVYHMLRPSNSPPEVAHRKPHNSNIVYDEI